MHRDSKYRLVTGYFLTADLTLELTLIMKRLDSGIDMYAGNQPKVMIFQCGNMQCFESFEIEVMDDEQRGDEFLLKKGKYSVEIKSNQNVTELTLVCILPTTPV